MICLALSSAAPRTESPDGEPSGATAGPGRSIPSLGARDPPCRHGQRASQVNVYHFVAQGYKDRERRNFSESASDLEADLEFLMRVARKIETIREELIFGRALAERQAA